ncbi:MAG TPA: DUF3343 domain-containing protein [Deltaproteobacteria bacterium]|nr:DUF3343 domain-containing protein [Deltaproteobacteria bacterium]HQI80561.1 DUF3343 domain-containing protein [Deltaproteobacteria bacterium]
MSTVERWVLVFESVSATLAAEQALKEKGIPYKLVPIPRHISSDCGVCIRVDAHQRALAEEVLAGRVRVAGVHRLPDSRPRPS